MPRAASTRALKLTSSAPARASACRRSAVDCAVCRSPDPRDRRTRVGALVETDGGHAPAASTRRPSCGCSSWRRASTASMRCSTRTTTPTTPTASTTCARSPRGARSRCRCTASARHAATIARASSRTSSTTACSRCPARPSRRGGCACWTQGVTVAIAGVDVTPVRVPHGLARGVRVPHRRRSAYVTDAKSVPRARDGRAARRARARRQRAVPHAASDASQHPRGARRRGRGGRGAHVPHAPDARQTPTPSSRPSCRRTCARPTTGWWWTSDVSFSALNAQRSSLRTWSAER